MPTKFALQVLQMWEEKGWCVETYRQTSDEGLRKALDGLLIHGHACAALTYRWIARQLLRDKIITTQRPAFTSKVFTPQKKHKVALNQGTYGLLAVLGPEGVVPDKDSEKVHLEETIKLRLGEWVNLDSCDTNIGQLVDLIQQEIQTALSRDERQKLQIKSRALRGLSHTHPWVTSFDSFYNQSPDYWAYLSVKSKTFGHAMGIRYDASTGQIHFFDSNTGHWVFPSWSKFKDNLIFYWAALWMEDDDGTVKAYFPEGHKFLQAKLFRFRRRCDDEILNHLVFGDGDISHYYTSGFIK